MGVELRTSTRTFQKENLVIKEKKVNDLNKFRRRFCRCRTATSATGQPYFSPQPIYSLPTISSVASLVTSNQAALVKKLNHTNHNSNSLEKNKMTNFSIAAIMNNERGSSGLVRPMPASETKLG